MKPLNNNCRNDISAPHESWSMRARLIFIISAIGMANKISAKLTLFLLALKNSNTDRGITFDDFITEIRPLNKGRVSRFEFLKIV
jgi:hypothetical protein